MRFAAVGLVTALALHAGCGPAGAYACRSDDQCTDAGASGRCEASGFCSFPDPQCESGQRFGEHSGDGLGGTCVPVDATSSGPPGTATSTTGVVTTTDSGGSSATSIDIDPTASSSSTTDGCSASWDDCGHPSRRSLLIAGGPGELDRFPVPVTLAPDVLAGYPGLDPTSLRVFDELGNALPFDIERYDPTSTSLLWISVPALTASATTIFLYYGGEPLTPLLDPALVWLGEFVEVWHLDASMGRVGERVLAPDNVTIEAGLLGSASRFDGSDSRLAVSRLPLFPPVVTLSAWIYPDDWGEIGYGRVFDSRNNPGGGNGFSLLIADGEFNNNTIAFVHGCESGDAEWVAGDDAIARGQWQHVAVTYDPSSSDNAPMIFVDGIQVEVEQFIGNGCVGLDPNPTFAIGNVGNTLQRGFDGLIDESRISLGAHDPVWIAYEYASAQPGFVTIGDETPQP